MRPLLLLLLFVTASASRATPLVEAQWKLKGTDAAERVKQAGHPLKIQNSPLRLEVMLDTAFGMHAVRPDLVHRLDSGGGDEFDLVISASPGQLFILTYLYTAEGTLRGARIASLPKDWTLFFPPDRLYASTVDLMSKRRARLGGSDGQPPPKPLVVNAPDGMLVFDLVAPLDAFVYERELNIPTTLRDSDKTPPTAEQSGSQDAPPKTKRKVPAPAAGAPRPKEAP